MINKVKLSPGCWQQWYRDPVTKKPLTGVHRVEILLDNTEYEFPSFVTSNSNIKFEFYIEKAR